MYRSVTWVIWLCECVFYQLPKIVSVEFLIFLYVLSAKFNKHDKKQIWITQCLQCYCLVCYRTNIKMNFYPNFFFFYQVSYKNTYNVPVHEYVFLFIPGMISSFVYIRLCYL